MHPEFCGSEVCVLQDSFTCKQQKAQLQFSSAGGAGGQGLWALGRGQAPYVRAARTPSRGSLGFVLLPVAAAALLSGREGPGAPRRGRGPGRGASGVGGQGVRPASLPAGLALPRCSRGRWLGVRCAEPRVFGPGSAGRAGENPPRQGLTSLKLAPQVGGCPLPGFSFFFCVLRSPGRGGGRPPETREAASPGQEADSSSLSVRRGEESWTKSDQGRSGKYRSQVCFRAPRDPGKSKECRQMKSGF